MGETSDCCVNSVTGASMAEDLALFPLIFDASFVLFLPIFSMASSRLPIFPS